MNWMRFWIIALPLLACAGGSQAQAPIVDAVRSGTRTTVGAVAERTAAEAKPDDPAITLARARAPELRKPRPLRDALQALSRQSGVPVQGLWKRPEGVEGIDPDRIVAIETPAASCADVLDAIADMLSREGEPVSWQRSRNGVELGRRSALWRPSAMEVRVYSLQDLLLKQPAFLSNAVPMPSGSSGTGSGSSGGTGSSGPGGSIIDTRVEAEHAARRGDLANLIQLTVEPEAWESRGGPCTMMPHDGVLVIRAPDFVHRQIESPRARAQSPSTPARGGVRP